MKSPQFKSQVVVLLWGSLIGLALNVSFARAEILSTMSVGEVMPAGAGFPRANPGAPILGSG